MSILKHGSKKKMSCKQIRMNWNAPNVQQKRGTKSIIGVILYFVPHDDIQSCSRDLTAVET